jgi:hypothetical protein
MSRRSGVVSLVAAGALLACLGAASVAYVLRPGVLDQGGGYAVSSEYEMRASVGGAPVAADRTVDAESPNYRLEAGSVTMIEAAVPPPPPPADDGCMPSSGGGGRLVLPLVALSALALAWRRRRPAGAGSP